jgi:undecaprenyl-diphosphatase
MLSSRAQSDPCSIFGRLPEGARKTFRLPVWAWILGSVILVGLAVLTDARMERLLYGDTSSTFHEYARRVSRLGEGWVIAVAGVAVSGLLCLGKRFRGARLVFLVALVSLLTGLSGTLLRTVVGRTRPNSDIPQGVYGMWHGSKFVAGKSDYGSFPSGHATTVAGLAVAAWMFSRKLGGVSWVYAVMVSLGRVVQGAHHFSDVVAGTLLAGLLAPWMVILVSALMDRLGRKAGELWGAGWKSASEKKAAVRAELEMEPGSVRVAEPVSAQSNSPAN